MSKRVGDMQKKLTDMERLIRRINKEFPKKKFIGDIMINDREFLLLLQYLRMAYKKMLMSGMHNLNDPVYCVALVQIGIRAYDGNFWTHVKKMLANNNFNTGHQAWLGTSFINTLKFYDKIYLNDSDRVNCILMHGFVSDKFADKFFNFLYSFYRIDLDRDISRLDGEAMNELIKTIEKNDNTGRTYWLVEHTADAVRNNSRGAKIRLRRYIKLIDKAFWGEKLPEKSSNRLIKHFLKWVDTSEEFNDDKGVYDVGKYLSYKLSQMQEATDTKDYEIEFKVIKNNGDWDVSQLSDDNLKKIHGIYEYEE